VPGRSQRDLRARGNQDVDRETHQLGREIGKPLDVPLRGAELDDEVLALHIDQFSQTLCEGLEGGGGGAVGRRPSPATPYRIPSTLAYPDPWSVSVEDRGQKDAPRLIVEAHTHERHGLHHAESMRQTPAE
jgi:hypothetical protein